MFRILAPGCVEPCQGLQGLLSHIALDLVVREDRWEDIRVPPGDASHGHRHPLGSQIKFLPVVDLGVKVFQAGERDQHVLMYQVDKLVLGELISHDLEYPFITRRVGQGQGKDQAFPRPDLF